MLFGRFGKHIREQNWFAVAIDFLIVVFGVFIGFQLDNWNEARKNRAEEHQYLLRLYDDMSATIEQTKSSIAFMRKNADRAGVVLRDLKACRIPDVDGVDFANGLYQLGKLYAPILVRGTIDELQSTGKMFILRDVGLRRQINETVQTYEDLLNVWPQALGRLNSKVSYVDRVVAYRIEGPHDGGIDIALADVEFDLDSLCTDRRFYTAVAAVRNYSYDIVVWHQDLLVQYKDFQAYLAEELNLPSQRQT